MSVADKAGFFLEVFRVLRQLRTISLCRQHSAGGPELHMLLLSYVLLLARSACQRRRSPNRQ
jgi:hypothetical protein